MEEPSRVSYQSSTAVTQATTSCKLRHQVASFPVFFFSVSAPCEIYHRPKIPPLNFCLSDMTVLFFSPPLLLQFCFFLLLNIQLHTISVIHTSVKKQQCHEIQTAADFRDERCSCYFSQTLTPTAWWEIPGCHFNHELISPCVVCTILNFHLTVKFQIFASLNIYRV